MDQFDKAFTMILAGWLAYEIFVSVKLFGMWSKEKEKAISINLYHIVYLLIMAVLVTLSFANGHLPTASFVLFLLCSVLCVPSLMRVFTPDKLIVANPRSGWNIPAKNVSYEYTQGKLIKETLVLHYKDDDRTDKFNLGVQNQKLITILNDNYKKHGCSNPLLKEDK
ncbi:MAG: hypothetical protein J6I46_14310 [Ruminococcus sp.]|nr:hypothetical protein [Ruminococcus sp.]MBQ1431844.1 hypothetical protein [Ruminococcus sp.]